MSIRKIARMGHPVLRAVAEPVPPEEIGSVRIQTVIADLLETVDDAEGAGLAAPQIHESLRIVALCFDEAGMRVWINPELTPFEEPDGGGHIFTFEGCLSVPDLRGLVGRAGRVGVRALERDGSPVELELEGFPAVIAQHECAHLAGVLYVDRAVPRTLSFLDEYRRYMAFVDDDDEEDDMADEMDEVTE